MNSQSNVSPDVTRPDTEVLPDPALLPPLDSSGDMHDTAPTRFVEVDGIRSAYRRFGDVVGTPVVLLQHFMGNLDTEPPWVSWRLD